MRIESLTLERYGRFTDRVLQFRADAALHVVLGANEAGKTSALSAISDLLFEFGHTTPYDFAHETKTLRVGGTLRLADGSALTVRRRKGNKNTLLDANDQSLADDLLAPILGNVTRETFRSEFGLTAEALRSGGQELLKAGGRLAETLAASSAGLTALSRLRERFGLEADALFTQKRSAGKTFYVAAKRHDDAERRLRDAVVTAEALSAADTAVEHAATRFAELTAEHERAGRDLARSQRAVRTRTKLARLQALGRQLDDFTDLPSLPAQTVAGWRAALSTDTHLSDELGKLAAADAADVIAIAQLGVDEALLSAGTAIDSLRERIGAVRKAVEDLPRRREAKRAAEDALNDAARRLGLASHEELLARFPADPAQARVRELIVSGTRAAERHREALEQRDRAVREREQFIATSQGVAEVVDPEPARLRLDALADVPADADRLRRDLAACDAEELGICEAAAALDPAAGDPGTLSRLPLPDEAAIAAHGHIVARAAEELREGQAKLMAADRAIEAANAEIGRLSRAGAIATRADLLAARAERDVAFENLHLAISTAATDRNASFTEVRSRTRSIDEITDQLLTDTERAARRQSAEDRLLDAQADRERAATELAKLGARRDEADAAWASLWSASGIHARTPTEMIAWRERVTGILNQRTRLAEKRAESAALAARLDVHRAALTNLFENFGWLLDPRQSIELLYREAKGQLEGMTRAWTATRAHAVARNRAERDVVEAETAVAGAESALAAHAAAWPAAVETIGLMPSASKSEAEAALAIWQAVGMPKQSLEREGRSVEGIERDLASFDREVAAVVEAAAPDLAGRDAQDALGFLVTQLGEARRSADARSRLREAATERAATRATLISQREAIRQVLGVACETMATPDIAGLGPHLERLEQRQALETERSTLERDLVEIADGLDAAMLLREQSQLDADLVPGEIERLGLRQSQLLSEIAAASAGLHQAKQDRDVLAEGRDANSAARERAEAAAELLSIAERWIVRAAASRLASRAIEHHRAAVQDPLIARAGALFKVATADAFSGLGADYDDADRPVLAAVRADGTRVPVPGLSEGTRDQLFLALRLALLERRKAEPLPFIGDDLLASFDEERTARTLDLLAAFGQSRQVILFTHHSHVAQLAQAVPDHVIDVIAL